MTQETSMWNRIEYVYEYGMCIWDVMPSHPLSEMKNSHWIPDMRFLIPYIHHCSWGVLNMNGAWDSQSG